MHLRQCAHFTLGTFEVMWLAGSIVVMSELSVWCVAWNAQRPG